MHQFLDLSQYSEHALFLSEVYDSLDQMEIESGKDFLIPSFSFCK